MKMVQGLPPVRVDSGIHLIEFQIDDSVLKTVAFWDKEKRKYSELFGCSCNIFRDVLSFAELPHIVRTEPFLADKEVAYEIQNLNKGMYIIKLKSGQKTIAFYDNGFFYEWHGATDGVFQNVISWRELPKVLDCSSCLA